MCQPHVCVNSEVVVGEDVGSMLIFIKARGGEKAIVVTVVKCNL